MQVTEVPAGSTPAVAAPEPFLAGTFALFEQPDGAVVITYRLADGREGKRRFPRAMVRAGMRAAQRAGRE